MIKNKKSKKTINILKSPSKTRKRKISFSPSVNYHDELMAYLKDHKNAVEYLNTALEESLKEDAESRTLFLRALKNVAEAQGNISDLARRSNIRRESIYRILSSNGNPEMQTVTTLLDTLGFGFKIYEINNTKNTDLG